MPSWRAQQFIDREINPYVDGRKARVFRTRLFGKLGRFLGVSKPVNTVAWS
jgi:hypothetical protein